jgi:lipopolysaccharide export system protein LptA
MKRHILVFLWAFMSLTVTFANTQTQSRTPHLDEPNIKIVSEEINCDQSKNICIAKGNAVAEKLNESKIKLLKADQITAHFAKQSGTGALKVTHMEAVGNVFFIIGDIIIQGLRGHYNSETDIAEIFDNVKITNDKNQLDGGYARVNMKTGHYVIKRDGERVSALIFTQDKRK